MRKKYLLAVLCVFLMTGFARAETITLTDDRVSFDLPAGFTPMSKEEIQVKYPNGTPPTLAYGNANRSVSVSVSNSTVELTSSKLDEFRIKMAGLLTRIVPGIEWKKNEIIMIKNKRWVHFEIMSNAVDTDIHNHMYLTDVDGKMFGINLNATLGTYYDFEKDFESVIKSLKVKE